LVRIAGGVVDHGAPHLRGILAEDGAEVGQFHRVAVAALDPVSDAHHQGMHRILRRVGRLDFVDQIIMKFGHGGISLGGKHWPVGQC
jgi:hypothetical protein